MKKACPTREAISLSTLCLLQLLVCSTGILDQELVAKGVLLLARVTDQSNLSRGANSPCQTKRILGLIDSLVLIVYFIVQSFVLYCLRTFMCEVNKISIAL